MAVLCEEMQSGDAALRIDVHGAENAEHILDEMTFLNYRLASVRSRKAPIVPISTR